MAGILLGESRLATQIRADVSALRTLSAASNSLQVGAGLVLRLPRLQELDLSGNKLVAVPPLDGLPQLQVLHLQRNQIASNWEELQVCASTLREVDVSHNRLSWAQQHGEFESAMAALSKLKRLRELRLVGNPVAETPGMRFFLITAAPKLERLDGWDVSESERRGKLKGAPAPPAQGGSRRGTWVLLMQTLAHRSG